MSDFRVVYLIVEHGRPEQPNFWRVAGTAFVCRDGSLNLKLDIFPGLRFNIREPKSNGERADAGEPKPGGEHPARDSPATGTFANEFGSGHFQSLCHRSHAPVTRSAI